VRKIKVRDLLKNASGSACPTVATFPGVWRETRTIKKLAPTVPLFFQTGPTELKTYKATEDTELTEKCGISRERTKTGFFQIPRVDSGSILCGLGELCGSLAVRDAG
jgi:hypothetical protein